MKTRSIILSLLCLSFAALARAQETEPTAANLALQVALDRQGFSVGTIDGKAGAKTRAAVADFTQAAAVTDEADLHAKLGIDKTLALIRYTVTQADRDQIGTAPADWIAASQVPAMACESLPEVLSEKFHIAEDYLHALNPTITDWASPRMVGTTILVPNVLIRDPAARAARITVDCRQFRLRAWDAAGKLLLSLPCSLAMEGKVVPTGALKVTACARNPTYTFDPKNYPESERAQQIGKKLVIPAGPNTPVGVFWIGLNLPGFGIHGTPHPETIGCRESHGCFRLTNWDVLRLGRMVAAGVPVVVTGMDVHATTAP